MRNLILVACLQLPVTALADAAAVPPPDCAKAAAEALGDAFEQWWFAGRLHEDGAGLCLDRLRASAATDDAGNVLRQARRLAASGDVDAAMKLAEPIAVRTGLSAADRAEADATLGELLLARERFGEAQQRLAAVTDADTSAYRRLRVQLAQARLAALRRDGAACAAAAAAAMALAEKQFGGDPEATARGLLAHAVCLRQAGDHGGSIASLQRVWSIEQARGEYANHDLAAQALVLLGQGYKISGDYARAARGYEQALAYLRAHPEPLPLQLSALLHGMANLERAGDRKSIERSLQRYIEAITLFERVYGTDSTRVSQVLNNYGNALGLLGRYDEAIAAYDRALAIAVARDKDVDPATLMPPISNKAMVRLWQKRYAEAETGFRRGLEIVAGQAAGTESSTLFSRLGLAASLWGQGRHAVAYAEAARAERDRQLAVDRALVNMSEASAIRYQEVLSPGLDMAIAIAYDSADSALVARAWSLAMAARGQVSVGIAVRLAQARASTDPALQEQFARWQQRSVRLAELRLSADSERRDALTQAEDALNEAEQALATALPGSGSEIARADIDPATLLAALQPLGANLVGFVSSSLRSPDEYEQADVQTRPRGVYAFVGQAQRAPRLLYLADERVIAAAVEGWRLAAGDPHSSPQRLRRAGTRLRKLVFDPLGVPADGLLLQVPYGDLHQLNPAALPDGDGYLIERGLRVHTLRHERDLLRAPMLEPDALRVLAVSDPAYGTADTGVDAARTDACSGAGWRPLPGSRSEVGALQRLLPASAKMTDLHGAQASKAKVLAALPGQDIIHLATHGLRRDRDCATPTLIASRGAALAPKAGPDTPSGDGVGVLVLSSDNAGAAASAGYLSEADIAGLGLERARWVVLSACDTGLADSRAYEGAFGLRRAFHMAGARSVIMSLWRVDDAATADWMAALYAARLQRGASTIDAVAQAQRHTLAARRAAGQSVHPYYWAAFISAGDWR